MNNLLFITNLSVQDPVHTNPQLVFQSDKEWKEHLLSLNEFEKLNYLLGMAISSQDLEYQLTTGQSDFCKEWGISAETQEWIRRFNPQTLEEFAIALLENIAAS